MTNDNLQKHIDTAHDAYQAPQLSATERATMRAALLAMADATPAPVSRAIPSPYFSVTRMVQYASFVAAAFLIAVVPVAFAANESIPGELLYGMKTSVNEPVRALFVADEDRDEFYQSLVAERVEELQLAKAEAKLDDAALEAFSEVLEVTIDRALAAADASGEPEDEKLQDYQAVVVALEISNTLLVDDVAPVAIAVRAMATTESADAPDARDTEQGTGAVFVAHAQKIKAVELRARTIFDEHVAAAVRTGASVTSTLAKEIRADTEVKRAAIVSNKAPAASAKVAVTNQVQTESMTMTATGTATTTDDTGVAKVALSAPAVINLPSTDEAGAESLERALEEHEEVLRLQLTTLDDVDTTPTDDATSSDPVEPDDAQKLDL